MENNKLPPPPFTPGWNDPPELQYSPKQTTRTKLNLKSRVNFSFTGGETISSHHTSVPPLPPPSGASDANQLLSKEDTVVGLPPPVKSIPAAPPPPVKSIPAAPPIAFSSTKPVDVPSAVPENIPDQSSGPLLVAKALEAITYFQHRSKSKDISAKIEACRTDINGDRLPAQVLEYLIEICESLQCPTKSMHQTLDMYQQLMVNHIEHCSSWGTAIRQIINEAANDINASAAPSISELETQVPLLVPTVLSSTATTERADKLEPVAASSGSTAE